MSASSSPLERLRPVLERAGELYRDRPALHEISRISERLDEPLRVAIAGRVKAGKSTLLNALVGESLAPTDAGECTRIVTWYRDGVTYRVTVHPIDGDMAPARFHRDNGVLEVDLEGRDPLEIDRLVVEWPTEALREMTLIDTPGLGSATSGIAARSEALLDVRGGGLPVADAVIYLVRHLHPSDVDFLEAFQDRSLAAASSINALGVLSRADELGSGDLDSLVIAADIANRYSHDRRMRGLVQTVAPVAALLALAAHGLTESDLQAVRELSSMTPTDRQALMLTTDRFVSGPHAAGLPNEQRADLLSRFGLFGLRLSVSALLRLPDLTASELSELLRAVSGVDDLRSLLVTRFARRADVIKFHAAQLSIEAVVAGDPVEGSEGLLGDLERVSASMHELAELRLVNALRSGAVPLELSELIRAERIAGGDGPDVVQRLDLPSDAGRQEQIEAAVEALRAWQVKAESPMSPRPVVQASRVLVRSCEGMIAALTAPR